MQLRTKFSWPDFVPYECFDKHAHSLVLEKYRTGLSGSDWAAQQFPVGKYRH